MQKMKLYICKFAHICKHATKCNHDLLATFQCRVPFLRRPPQAASDTSSLPSPWTSCTCNHPGPFDGHIFNADMWRLQFVTLLKMLTFHSSKDLHPKRPSTLFLNHNIGLVWLVRTLPLQSELETRQEKSPGLKASNKLSHLLPLLTHHKIHLKTIVRQWWRQCKWWQGQQCCSQSQCCQKCNNDDTIWNVHLPACTVPKNCQLPFLTLVHLVPGKL